MSYSFKSLRKQFAEKGVFYTDEKLAKMLAEELSIEDIDEHEVECVCDAELNYSEYCHCKTFSLSVSQADYCTDTFNEEDAEYNTYFDNSDFTNFEKKHEYEEF